MFVCLCECVCVRLRPSVRKCVVFASVCVCELQVRTAERGVRIDTAAAEGDNSIRPV